MTDATAPKTILIADDDQFVTIAYKSGFEQAGYKVMTAKDGEEALGLIRSTLPDLVMLDIIMPKTDGFEVLQAVKGDPGLSHIPVLVFTNLTQQSDEEAARKYGADDFLIKADASLHDVLGRVQHLLDNAAAAKPPTSAPLPEAPQPPENTAPPLA